MEQYQETHTEVCVLCVMCIVVCFVMMCCIVIVLYCIVVCVVAYCCMCCIVIVVFMLCVISPSGVGGLIILLCSYYLIHIPIIFLLVYIVPISNQLISFLLFY